VSDYSEVFLDHYRRPRNLGDLESPHAVAIVHDDTCGDLLRLAITVADADGAGGPCITAARCKAYGCAATIAVASVLTELIEGREVAAAAELTVQDLIAALDGLPPGRLHAATLGCAALRAALTRLRPGSRRQELPTS
jgi:NifU-like protein involved in Fe-S cluster formation